MRHLLKEFPCTVCGGTTKVASGDLYYSASYVCTNKKCHRHLHALMGAENAFMEGDERFEYGQDTCTEKKLQYIIDRKENRLISLYYIEKSDENYVIKYIKRISKNDEELLKSDFPRYSMRDI